MTLLSGTPSIRAGQAAGTNGTTSQETAHLQEAILCGLSLQQNDQETLEGQGRQQGHSQNWNTTKTGCLRGPA